MLRRSPLFLALACITSAHAFDAVRVPNGSLHIDGRLDEAQWSTVAPHTKFFEAQPADRIPANVDTEVRVLYDDAALYVSVRAADPDVSQLRAPFARRDRIGTDQDYVTLYLDPSGKGESAQLIQLNPRGAVSDGSYTDGPGDDLSPDLDLEVATSRDAAGWTAEVRIPFCSLAYPSSGTANWKLLVLRNRTRDERYRMFSAPVTRADNCALCYAEPINGLRDLPSAAMWSITPQLTARRMRETTQGVRHREQEVEPSLDAKIRLDSASVVDLTLRPDFSQVELDAPQLSANTRFGLFVPEKRPFFLEGSDLFVTQMKAVSTRSITQPSWGARYTRRSADHDLTVLTAHDDGGGVVLLPTPYYTGYAAQSGGSQASIARAVFRLGGVTVGALATDRTYDHERGYNRVAGADFTWQRSSGERMRGQLLVSATTAQPDANGNLAQGPRADGHAAMVEWSREAERWSINAVLQEVSRNFRDDNGFFPQNGFRTGNVLLVDKRGAVGPLRELNWYLFGERKVDDKGALVLDSPSIGTWMAGPYDSEFELHAKPVTRTRVTEGGPIFETARVGGRVGATPGPALARVGVELEMGDQIDVEGARVGKGGNLTAQARIRLGDRIELEPVYSTAWADARDSGARLFKEQAAQLNGIVHLSARDTVRLIVQLTRTSRNQAMYTHAVAESSKSSTASVVYGHTPSLGTAAYAGVTVSHGETPGYAPLRRANEVFVKLSWHI